MKTIIRILGVAVIAAHLAACATTSPATLEEQGHRSLSKPELKSLVADGAVFEWRATDSSGTTEYRADGTSVTDWGAGDNRGTWRLDGNQLCSRYAAVAAGRERCFSVYHVDNEYLLFVDDRLCCRGTFRSED